MALSDSTYIIENEREFHTQIGGEITVGTATAVTDRNVFHSVLQAATNIMV